MHSAWAGIEHKTGKFAVSDTNDPGFRKDQKFRMYTVGEMLHRMQAWKSTRSAADTVNALRK